jgi:hypothetical protein
MVDRYGVSAAEEHCRCDNHWNQSHRSSTALRTRSPSPRRELPPHRTAVPGAGITRVDGPWKPWADAEFVLAHFLRLCSSGSSYRAIEQATGSVR